MIDFIDAHRVRFGVEPMCRVLCEHGLHVAPSTFYAAKTRPPSARAVADAELLAEIRRVWEDRRRGRRRLLSAPTMPTGAKRRTRLADQSFDNAMAESVIGLYKREGVRHEGPFRAVEDLELATLDWVHWFNEHRLNGALGHVPPIEFETHHYCQINAHQQPLLGEPSLH